MTQEEKQLVLKDLCARLQHGVKVNHFGVTRELLGIIPSTENVMVGYDINEYEVSVIEDIKPYLRPISSMTEEEREELSDYLCEKVMSNKIGITIPPSPTQGKGIPFIWMGDCLDWLNKKGFDYRGLIPMGLALPATERMYNIK